MIPSSRRASALAIAAALLTALGAAPVRAADIDVVLAIPAQTLTFSAAFIAEDAGFYKKHGLNVTSRALSGVASNNAVINGNADFLLGTAATMLNGAARGQPLLMLANMVNRPMVELVIRKDIADAAGITSKSPLKERIKLLKDKTVAVQGIGSITHSLPRLVARQGGFDPETDIRVTPMAPPAMVAALANKQIDAYSTSLPYTTDSVLRGTGIILVSGPQGDMSEYYPFAYLVLGARAENCEKNREKCARMVAAYQDAARFINEKPAETWELLKKRFPKMDPKVLGAAWAVVSKVHPVDVRISEKALDNAQKWSQNAGLLDPANEVKDYKGLWTAEFVK